MRRQLQHGLRRELRRELRLLTAVKPSAAIQSVHSLMLMHLPLGLSLQALSNMHRSSTL